MSSVVPPAVPSRAARIRARLAHVVGESAGGSVATLLLAVVAGLAGGLATLGFRAAIRGIQILIGGQGGGLVAMAEQLPAGWRIAVPALGGVSAGSVLWYAQRLADRSGDATPNDYMHAAAVGNGHVPVVQSLLRGSSSLLTIASGGSIGREGAMVQLAALTGSLFGRAARLDPLRLRLMVACGAAAGLTAAYNAPIASAFFVSEIVLGSFAMDSLAPILVAAVTSNVLMRALPGYHPTYSMPAFPSLDVTEIPLMVLLGVVGGVGAAQFLRALRLGRWAFSRFTAPLPVKLGLGGLIVGVISIWVPQVWGNGFSVTNSLLHDPWIWTSVLLIFVAKIVATAATTGSGAIGGIFTPTLYVGATVGWLFGNGVDAIVPGTFQPAAYAVVGMGAFLAGATGAPIMAILMIFEFTSTYEAMLPLMLACVVAWTCARALGAPAMYEAVVKRQAAGLERSRLAQSTIASLIRPAETVARRETPFDALMQMFLSRTVKYLYVVDDGNRFVGAVRLQDLLRAMVDDNDRSTRVAADFLQEDFVSVPASASLSDALECVQTLQAERIPVVDDATSRKLLGVVRKSDLLDVLGRLALSRDV